MRLLAVDQGSLHVGLAFYSDDHRLEWTRRISPPSTRPWLERMRWIGDQMYLLLKRTQVIADVVAIEDVVFGRNAKVAVTMGENRGFLLAVLTEAYPAARVMSIAPATVRATVGAPRSRAGAKDHIKAAVAALLDLRGVSEDEADAAIIGLAAYERMRRESVLARAEEATGERKVAAE